eukprot:TRINITY_DN754_c0_g1_i3.p1 TRINITY_DN754_c0_g1~~TRINITY_DN754_c0_g1_i3.p1  ORF type:complete len:317 (-),score=27.94 TRINITY_DN754_c0_g1_i3:843-1751(-)
MPICFWANASMFGSPDSFENNNAENDVQSRKRDVRSSVTEDECWVVNKQQKTEADNVALIDGFDGQRVQSESSPIGNDRNLGASNADGGIYSLSNVRVLGCDQHAMVENVSSQAVIRCEPTPQQPCSVENQQLAAAQQQQAVELQSATPDHVCMMSQEPALSNPSEHSQRDMDCQGEDSVEAGKSKQGKAVCDMKMQKQLGGVVNYLNPPAQEIFQKFTNSVSCRFEGGKLQCSQQEILCSGEGPSNTVPSQPFQSQPSINSATRTTVQPALQQETPPSTNAEFPQLLRSNSTQSQGTACVL